MHNDMNAARSLLDQGNYTCVLCRGETVRTATKRGVAPLLHWVESGLDCTGFSAADRVVGRGAAFLYCLLGVTEVYANIMSKPAAEVLQAHGIATSAGTMVEGIINRQGTGPCPFEAAVMNIDNAPEALAAIRTKMAQLLGGN